MTLVEPTIDAISDALRAAGFASNVAEIALEPSDGRVLVRLGEDRMAWFPLDEDGRAGMERERRVLRLIAAHCSFRAPRVLHEDRRGWDLRAIVPGVSRPFAPRTRLKTDRGLAQRTGTAIGLILADQHTNIPPDGLEGCLPPAPNWPRAEDIPRLPEVTGDTRLLARIERALARAAEAARDRRNPVLAHTDVALHNIAFDPVTDDVAGVFDYEGAAFTDRCHDFKYLILDEPREPLLEAALAAYEPLTGVAVDRGRIRLLHAASAIAFLAYRAGRAPEEPWCGRTLAEDLSWTSAALTAAQL